MIPKTLRSTGITTKSIYSKGWIRLKSAVAVSTPPNTLYTTTPIFYVNANPHLGHLYSMLLCDTRNRWEKLNPRAKTFFTTGTDEHGLKIQTVAEKQNISPKDLTDKVSQNFKVLATDLDIDYDRFIRTTDQDHVKAVQFFWELMQEKGYLYEGSHSGWYSVSDETFYPETQIEPIEGNPGKMRSKETKSEVVYQQELNYFFKLSAFQDRLIEYLETNPDFIIPKTKYTQLLNELKEGPIGDLSVSRPSSRLTWGIPVPNDPSQRIYVWFDALINYITSCGFPNSFIRDKETGLFKSGNAWPATHVIGKDIIRFHCIYWPIFLMAAGIELPEKVVVHSHWLSDGFKMSKSLGNVVDPQATAAYYGQDSLRFFLMEYSNIESDCNYREDQFHFTRETIIGKFANLITRCGGSAFNIEKSVEYAKLGKYEQIDELIGKYSIKTDIEEVKLARDKLEMTANSLYSTMNSHIVQFDQLKAIGEWWSLVERANELFQTAQPWLYTKALKDVDLNAEDREALLTLQLYYTYLAAESSRIACILINPIMPKLSTMLLDRLNVDPTRRNADFAAIGLDLSYGHGANEKTHKIPIVRIPMRETNL